MSIFQNHSFLSLPERKERFRPSKKRKRAGANRCPELASENLSYQLSVPSLPTTRKVSALCASPFGGAAQQDQHLRADEYPQGAGRICNAPSSRTAALGIGPYIRGGEDGQIGSSAPTFQTEKTPLAVPAHSQGRKLRGTTLIRSVCRSSLQPVTELTRPAYSHFSREAPGPEHPSCPPPCTIRRLSLRQVSGRIPLLRHITKSFYADSADLSSLRRRFPKFRSN